MRSTTLLLFSKLSLLLSWRQSSVKDRLAYAIIYEARESGALKPGQTVVEATSGNTGIGLAMVCAALGHPLVVVMAETFSIERRKTMRALGARVVLTPAAGRAVAMTDKAKELAAKHGFFLARQFETPANALVHAQTTAAEILSDFAHHPLDWICSGYGTGGTYSGVSSVVRVARPNVKLALAEPATAKLVHSGAKQPRHPDGSPAQDHPAFEQPHPVQGWTPSFLPEVLEKGLLAYAYPSVWRSISDSLPCSNKPDELITVTGPESIAMSLELARKEGIFTGISGGASVASAVKLAQRAKPGSHILTFLPDTAERYQSGPLYEKIPAEMSPQELELMRSTPSHHLKQ